MACLTQWNYELCHVGPPEMDGSWWRVLTKRSPLEKGTLNHFSILVLRTPWTVWKSKKIWHWKLNHPSTQVSRCPICYCWACQLRIKMLTVELGLNYVRKYPWAFPSFLLKSECKMGSGRWGAVTGNFSQWSSWIYSWAENSYCSTLAMKGNNLHVIFQMYHC